MKHLVSLRYLIAITTLLFNYTVQSAQETDPDSVVVDLGEIVVEGRTQRVIPQGVEYIPGKKMKRMSLDAVSLLSRMQIPQLNVNPTDRSVKTISKADVTFFFNYTPASTEEMEGLHPEDVLSVEVLDHPSDPRFGGAEYVVNFILRRYEWGGYTKLALQGGALSHEYVGGSVYEKFNYRKWMFDANVSASGSWDRKSKSFFNETFRDFIFDSRKIDFLERSKSTDYTHRRENSQMATFRASYADESGKILRHTISFNRLAAPVDRSSGQMLFSKPILPSSEFNQDNSSSSTNASVSGYYQFLLPSMNSIIANWSFSYSGNKQLTSYTLSNLEPIRNDVRENTYSPYISVFYSKQLPKGNIVRARVVNNTSIFDTKYTGGAVLNQKLVTSESLLLLEYMKNFGFGLNIYARAGASYLLAHLNGESIMKEWNPRLAVTANYFINSKNQLYFDLRWNNSSPQSAWVNDALVRQDELMWIKGNPDMRNMYGPEAGLTYSFVPLNFFSMSADLRYGEYRHMPVYEYTVEKGIDGIVRSFSDNNTDRSFSATLSATANLFRNSLILNIGGGFARQWLTGVHPLHINVLQDRHMPLTIPVRLASHFIISLLRRVSACSWVVLHVQGVITG